MANEKYVERIKSASTGVVYTIRDQDTASKQDILISGENIKTINDQSILGSGNIQISGTGAVDSVNGKTGAVVLNASDVHAATEAQGALADTAVQPSAISDMETKTHASSTYQAKLTSANAGTNVTITEESGVVKINAAGGSGGASTFAELQGQPTDNANLAAALNAKISTGGLKTINETSLEGSGNIELLTPSNVGTMAAEDKDDYYTKTDADAEFLTSSEGTKIETTLDEVLLQSPVSDIDVLSLESTVVSTGVWKPDGSASTTAGWQHYKIPNNKYLTLDVDLYSGNRSETNPYLVYFYSDDKTMNESTLISGAFPSTTSGSEVTGTTTIPENTKMIVVNGRFIGGVSISAMASGIVEHGRLPDIEEQVDILEDPVFHGKVQDGLVIAVLGSSTSTKYGRNAYEITITEEDVGVPLAAYLTYYDYYGLSGSTPVGFSLGGHTFTADEIGQQVYFTPIAEDVGKSIGLALRYSGNDAVKVWWQYLEDLGATVIPVCWSGSSISSHESATTIRRCSWSWHESQIRKLGIRIPGSMQRKAPDIIIISRGGNDMSHTPYALITDDYFDDWDWSYPTTDVVTGGWGLLEGFSMWVQRVRETYPYTQIVVATNKGFKRVNCSKFPVNNGIYSMPQYNDAIRSAANFFGMQTIDWDRCGITFENLYPEYSNDSVVNPTHPNAKGHWLMGRQTIIDLENKMDLLHITHRDSDSKLKFNVTQTLSGVTSSNTATTVIVGTLYTTTLEPANGTTVVVKQNGADITSSVYNSSTGVVTIDPVDGDISIEATASSVSYNITNTLTHVTNTNTNTTAGEYSRYSGELVSDVGYIKDSTTITMGGTDITSTVYSDGFINIPSVTGDIVITSSATQTIGGSYQIYNAKSGILNGASPTQFTMNDLSKAIVKFRTSSDVAGGSGYGSGGIYTKLFNTIYNVGSGSSAHPEFGTASSGAALTGVRPQPNTEYIAVYDNINQATSSLTIYAGDDENLTTPLGTGTRTAAGVVNPYAVYGTYGNNSPQGYTTKTDLIYTKLYDTNGTLIREYVPAIRTSDSEQGSYDKLTGEFVPLVVSE